MPTRTAVMYVLSCLTLYSTCIGSDHGFNDLAWVTAECFVEPFVCPSGSICP